MTIKNVPPQVIDAIHQYRYTLRYTLDGDFVSYSLLNGTSARLRHIRRKSQKTFAYFVHDVTVQAPTILGAYIDALNMTSEGLTATDELRAAVLALKK